MKKPVVDYTGFRLRRINEPQYAHIKLLLGWVFYFVFYFLTENLIPAERCHVVYCFLDDLVPFREGFVLFYVSWYVLIVISLLYFFLYDIQSFKDLSTFIIITQVVAMAVYILYPTRQDLRPAVFAHQNLFTWGLGIIYGFDTPTGVCPSLHVAYSLGILSVGLKDRKLAKGWKLALTFFVLMVCVSVCFVKQHSALDVLAALPLCLLAEALVYGRDYWLPRLRGGKSA